MFVGQLALDALWTWIFFAWRSGALALVEIVVLWAAIVLTIAYFRRVRMLAAWCLVPYLAWGELRDGIDLGVVAAQSRAVVAAD